MNHSGERRNHFLSGTFPTGGGQLGASWCPDRLSRGRLTPRPPGAFCAPEVLPCGAWPWMPPPPPPGNCTELLGLKLCCPLPDTLRPLQTRAPHCPVALGPANGAAPQSRLHPPRSQPVNEPSPPAAPEGVAPWGSNKQPQNLPYCDAEHIEHRTN